MRFRAREAGARGHGQNIVHCGATGMGQVAKVCNNLVLGISMAAVSEAMSLGVALGIDPKVLAGIVNTSTGRCWSSDTYNPYPGVIETAPSSRGYSGGFGTDLMLKDLGLANDAAKQARQPVYLGALARQLYQDDEQPWRRPARFLGGDPPVSTGNEEDAS